MSLLDHIKRRKNPSNNEIVEDAIIDPLNDWIDHQKARNWANDTASLGDTVDQSIIYINSHYLRFDSTQTVSTVFGRTFVYINNIYVIQDIRSDEAILKYIKYSWILARCVSPLFISIGSSNISDVLRGSVRITSSLNEGEIIDHPVNIYGSGYPINLSSNEIGQLKIFLWGR